MFISSLSSSVYFFSFFLCLFLLFLPLFISSFHLSFLSEAPFIFDEMTLFLCFLSVFVMFVSIFWLPNSSIITFSLFFMFVPCIMVFSVSNFFYLYMYYEMSLIPILFIILKWGSYPERSLSSLMLLLYTSLFSLPFLVSLLSMADSLGSLSMLLKNSYNFSSLFTLVVFCSFAVKLPIYGLHFWLPMAHVEAPTFGSMILAGILLKLGGLGLFRFMPNLNLTLLQSFSLSYFLIFLVFSTLICCFQSDFKRLVAYSSVSHMMSLPLLLLSSNLLTSKAMLSVMFFHGVSSPVMFMLVGLSYSIFSSRQLALTRGILIFSPLLSLVLILSFFYTLSAPPYPSFFSEILFLLCPFYLSNTSLLFFLFFVFLSLVYNLNWLSSLLFGSVSSLSMNKTLKFSNFLPLILSHFFSLIFLFIIPLF